MFTGNGLPQFVQNLPVFFCPHSHVHSVISCGIGLPQLLQNLPVFFCPHSHVQPDASSCCVAPEATPAAIPAAPFPGAFIPADRLFCAICVKPFIILPMVLIPMPTPMKPCIAPPLLLPAFLTPSDIFLTIYPCAIDGSESIAPSFLVLMSS